MASILETILCCCSDSTHPKQVTINGNSYKILEVIGEGGFGYVYRAQDLSFGGGGRGNRNTAAALLRGSGQTVHRQGAGDGTNTVGDGSTAASARGLPTAAACNSGNGDINGSLLHHGRAMKVVPSMNSVNDEDGGDGSSSRRNTTSSSAMEASLMDDEDRRAQLQRTRSDEVALKRFVLTDGATIAERVRVLSEAEHHSAASVTNHTNIVRFIDSEVKRSGGRDHHSNSGGGSGRSNNNNQYNTSIQSQEGRTRSMEASSEVWLVMELCHGGSLQDAVNYNLKHGGEFGALEVLGIVLQCAAAVAHLHRGVPMAGSAAPLPQQGGIMGGPVASAVLSNVPMAHWDIKLDNFLVAEVPLKTTADIAANNKKNSSNANSNGSPNNTSSSPSSVNNRGGRVTSASSFVSASTTRGDCGYYRHTIRLCDFGSATMRFLTPTNAKELAAAESELDGLMTLGYRAPETLDLWELKRLNEIIMESSGGGAGRATAASPSASSSPRLHSVDTKADVWSLGVVIYVLLFQEMPFDDVKTSVTGAVPKWTTPLPMWTRLDASVNIKAKLLRIVLDSMLVKDPSKRADMGAVCAALKALAEEAGYEQQYIQ